MGITVNPKQYCFAIGNVGSLPNPKHYYFAIGSAVYSKSSGQHPKP